MAIHALERARMVEGKGARGLNQRYCAMELPYSFDKGRHPAVFPSTGVGFILGSKVSCIFCFVICTPEGRGGEREGMQISKESTLNL